MTLQVFDTLTGNKREFVPLEPGKVSMYVCGVTPYSLCHLGHARCYVAWDIVYRYLCRLGYEVTYVRNFTDVDDKIINRANERKMDPMALAEENIQTFYEDMDGLGIARPQHEPRVSTSIDAIIRLIQQLQENGTAYAVDGDVYYEVDRFDGYGKLSKRDLGCMEAGARVEVDERKRNPMDFALWKSAKPGEPTWESPWGPGRPGWHIECSAMSMSQLGNTLDIHCGGRDLVFPHHENEIAQSEGATGCQYVRYWMHNGFINIDEQKMSKSLGNVFNIRDVTARYEPLVLRFFLISATHYRNPINFSDAMLDEAAAKVAYFYETLRKATDFIGDESDEFEGVISQQAFIDGLTGQFEDALNDDFHVVRGMEVIYEAFKMLNDLVSTRKQKQKPAARAAAARLMAVVRDLDSILNLFSHDIGPYLARHQQKAALRRGLDVNWINAQISERIAARTARDWARADEIRDLLLESGVTMMDRPNGTTDWKIDEGQSAEA